MMARVIDPARWFIVVNPASGAGRAARFWPRLDAALSRAGLAYDYSESAAPGDAEQIAARAVAGGFRRVLAVGGDGTLNELINGILASGVPTADCLVAAAAGGTGNDWACTMAVPDDAERLAACMSRGATRLADLGLAESSLGRKSAFHNVAGAGLDAEVIGRTPRAGPRALAYLVGLARTIATFSPPAFEVIADGRVTRGSHLLALASIGPRCGGGMRLTPGAVLDDGWLDLLMVEPMSLVGAFGRLPRLFDGRLAGDPAFRVSRCRTATISAEPPCGVELDGQLFGTTPVTISILPGALNALDCRSVASEVAGSSRANGNKGDGDL